jgi:hypothetical protein
LCIFKIISLALPDWSGGIYFKNSFRAAEFLGGRGSNKTAQGVLSLFNTPIVNISNNCLET